MTTVTSTTTTFKVGTGSISVIFYMHTFLDCCRLFVTQTDAGCGTVIFRPRSSRIQGFRAVFEGFICEVFREFLPRKLLAEVSCLLLFCLFSMFTLVGLILAQFEPS